MGPKIGHIQFLNCLPLYHMLLKSGRLQAEDLVKDTPTALGRRLLQGELSISPVPAIEYARNARDLILLPELTVSSNGKVMSILLVSKLPIGKLNTRRVALSNSSATSQVLTKIILEHRYGLAPFYFASPPDLPEMFREADAALLIGDDALRVYARPKNYVLYDLGSEWKAFTGKPMVYAVWAVRRSYAAQHPEEVRTICQLFTDSRRMSMESIEEIASDIARWEVFSKKFLIDYFKSLRFEFSTQYQEGLITYYRWAKKVNALKSIPHLEFVAL